MALFRFVIAVVCLASVPFQVPAKGESVLDLPAWLDQPNTRWLLVYIRPSANTKDDKGEPGIRKLSATYRDRGLSWAIIQPAKSTHACSVPNSKPDYFICASEHELQAKLGLEKVGATCLLWDWTGHLLYHGQNLESITQALEDSWRNHPLGVVESKDERSRSDPQLRARIRAVLKESKKFRLLDETAANKSIELIQGRWMESMLGKKKQCSFASPKHPDHYLRAKVEGLRRAKRLRLSLLSGYASCVIAQTTSSWRKDSSDLVLAEALRKLLNKARGAIQLPSQFASQPAQSAAGPEMIRIDAGTFYFGCNGDRDPWCDRDEAPRRRIWLDAFEIDRLEVSVAHYKECVEANRCQVPFSMLPTCNWNQSDRESHPINCVTWEQAQSYCVFGNKRLPTEAEWEKAARGPDGGRYPWGDTEPTCRMAVFSFQGKKSCGQRVGTWPVGSMPQGASPFGVLDQAGNVTEWVADWYAAYETNNTRNPKGPKEGVHRVLRGGGYYDTANGIRATNRNNHTPGMRNPAIGFRCARDVRNQ